MVRSLTTSELLPQRNQLRRWVNVVMLALWAGVGTSLHAQVAGASTGFTNSTLLSSDALRLDKKSEPISLWVDDSVGAGFHSGRQEFGLGVGGGFAGHEFGGVVPHDLVLGRIYYGLMLSDVVGKNWFFRGNWEILGELFGGGQTRPENGYAVGVAALLRYNFATGTRLMPFVDAGVGATATDIGNPDLGSIFEFNLQCGVGLNYFWRENSALTFQYRLIHFSNAGIKRPNLGVNENMFYLGMSWFF
jgi:lipid A 3-O-deacylase